MTRELGAGALGLAVPLRADDLEEASIAAGDEQLAVTRCALPGPRAVREERGAPRLPDRGAATRERRERTGVRMRDGADQIVNLARGAVPVDGAILGTTAAEVRGGRVILWATRRGTG